MVSLRNQLLGGERDYEFRERDRDSKLPIALRRDSVGSIPFRQEEQFFELGRATATLLVYIFCS